MSSKYSLELPQTSDQGQLLALLNDRFRQIQKALEAGFGSGDLDAAGFRITNVGDPKNLTDALNLATADRRYLTASRVQGVVSTALGGVTAGEVQALAKSIKTIASEPTPPNSLAGTVIQTAVIGGVPSFRFHIVLAASAGNATGYVVEVRYFSDAGTASPSSEWILVGTLDAGRFVLDTDYWGLPAVQDYAKVRVAAQNEDNALSGWIESSVLTRPASTGIDGVFIDPETLTTAAFASTIRPVTLVATAAALPSIPNALYPPGAVAYVINTAALMKVNAANSGWEKLVDGGKDIKAGTITANEIYANTITAGQIAAGAIGTEQLYAGEILVGGGAGKPTRFRVNDGSHNMIAFIGDNGAGFIGGYFVNLRVGPDINAPILSASSSGVLISGAKIVVTTASHGSIVIDPAASFHPVIVSDIASSNEVAIGANASVGGSVQVQSTNVSNRFPLASMSRGPSYAQVVMYSGATGSPAGVELRVDVSGGVHSGYVNIINGSLKIGGTEVINSSKQFVGAGVLCPGYGIGAAGFNPWNGSSYDTGQTVASQQFVYDLAYSLISLRLSVTKDGDGKVTDVHLEQSTDGGANWSDANPFTCIWTVSGYVKYLTFRGGALTAYS